MLTALEWVEGQRAPSCKVIVVTARGAKWSQLTRVWMRKLVIWAGAFYMRADGDQRKDRAVKTDILAEIRAAGYRVVAAIDDNPSIVELWRSEGIETTVVPGWDFAASQGHERPN